MDETLRWSHILMDWVTTDGGQWQQVFSIKAPLYFMRLKCVFPWVIQKACDLKDYGHNIFFYGNLTYAPWR